MKPTYPSDNSQVVLITGTNRGIGLEFVRKFLNKGYTVIATYRRISEDLERLKAQYNSKLCLELLDVSKETDFRAIATKYINSPINILINNAGIFPENYSQGGISETTNDFILNAFKINTLGAFMAMKYFLPNLKLSKTPRIINISSQMGILSYAKGFCYSYRISKVALNMLTKCFADEDTQIITVALRPGWAKTKLGGAGANLSVAESVSKMIKVIEKLTYKDSGLFFDNEKNECTW